MNDPSGRPHLPFITSSKSLFYFFSTRVWVHVNRISWSYCSTRAPKRFTICSCTSLTKWSPLMTTNAAIILSVWVFFFFRLNADRRGLCDIFSAERKKKRVFPLVSAQYDQKPVLNLYMIWKKKTTFIMIAEWCVGVLQLPIKPSLS